MAIDSNAPKPPAHHEAKELALQLLVADPHPTVAGAQAADRAREAYALAQVYLATIDSLDPALRRRGGR